MIKYLLLIITLFSCGLTSEAKTNDDMPVAMEIADDFGDINIFFDGSTLRVVNASGLNLYVYNITGVRVMSVKVEGEDKSFRLNLQRGCYIVKVGNVVRKISVK